LSTLYDPLPKQLISVLGVEKAYSRARELCQQGVDTPQHSQVLWGLWFFYHMRGEFRIALEQAEALLTLARRQQDPAPHLQAHLAPGSVYFHLGEFARVHAHLDQGIALYDPQQHRAHACSLGWIWESAAKARG
jgi:hypothetical protein